MKVVKCDVCGEEVELTRNRYETDLQFTLVTEGDVYSYSFPDNPIPECCLPCRDMLMDAVKHTIASKIALMNPKPKGVSNEKN